jgi:hypothetical protein
MLMVIVIVSCVGVVFVDEDEGGIFTVLRMRISCDSNSDDDR